MNQRYELMRNELSEQLAKDPELLVYDTMVQIRQLYQKFVDARNALNNSIVYAASRRGTMAHTLEDILAKHREYTDFERLSGYPHPPAFIVVIGYDPGNSTHLFHTFDGDWYEKGIPSDSAEFFREMKMIAYKDNAAILDIEGNLLAKKVLLTQLDPELIMKKNGFNPHTSLNSSEAMGFKFDVNARHKNALTASYHMEHAVIYTLGETTGDIRRMQQGHITHSTVDGEGKYHNHIPQHKI
jgi:hypothetical protein